MIRKITKHLKILSALGLVVAGYALGSNPCHANPCSCWTYSWWTSKTYPGNCCLDSDPDVAPSNCGGGGWCNHVNGYPDSTQGSYDLCQQESYKCSNQSHHHKPKEKQLNSKELPRHN
jgi:hypothetical protein